MAVLQPTTKMPADTDDHGPSTLSGYRIMWLIVLFDLPVGTRKQRSAATKFRQFLLDAGFEMSQFSVYFRHCAGKERAEALTREIESGLPASGKVHIVQITDRQYENIRTYMGRKAERSPQNPSQFTLF
jgi:CRISPR-associated protein Cas2